MSAATPTTVRTVLVAEDSVTQRMQLCYTLEKVGYKVLSADNGNAALKLVETEGVDAVVSDVVMPEMGGYDLCKAIKTHPQFSKIPFILLTTLYEPREIIRGLECGADTYIVKPYHEDNLVRRLNQLFTSPPVDPDSTRYFYGGDSFEISASKEQIVRFLMATYEETSLRNRELQKANQELQRAQMELNLSNEELKNVNAFQNQILGMAAHDLRNPLDVIRGYAEILLEDTTERLDPEEQKLLNIIMSASNFMLNLVNDLLDISKIESGTLQLKPDVVSPTVFLEESVAANRIFADRRGAQVVLTCPEEVPNVRLDVVRMHQVMNNILNNAIKFSDPGSVISVTLSNVPNDRIRISISDQGPGINEGELETIFQPFHQTEEGSSKPGGTGLGLAIVRRIVEAHKGTVTADNNPDRGATFIVTLPISPDITRY